MLTRMLKITISYTWWRVTYQFGYAYNTW